MRRAFFLARSKTIWTWPRNTWRSSAAEYPIKDKAHFIEVAFGSLMEVSSQFEIAEELDYITTEERMSMDELVKEVARLLSGLQNSYKPSTD